MRIVDCHNDFLTELITKKCLKYVSKLKDEKVISAVWTTKLSEDQIFKTLELGRSFSKLGKTMLAIEDCHFITPQNLSKVLSFNPIYSGLVWNEDNQFGGGANGISGLTKNGEVLCKLLEENNVLIDLAHSNEKTFYDIARITNKPLFCSHAAFFALKEHNRNVKDYQIKMIVESGGFIGLTFVSEFLSESKKATVNDICEHIAYFVSKFGINNLGFGTDFFGTKNLPKGINNYNDFKKISTQLSKLGFTQNEIDCLFYKNFADFIKNQS